MSISARNWAWNAAQWCGVPLKAGEKLTLLCLAEYESAEYGCAFPSHALIAERTCQSVRTVQTHLKALEKMNAFILEKRRGDKGTWLRNVYVLDVPESYRENDPEWMRLQG